MEIGAANPICSTPEIESGSVSGCACGDKTTAFIEAGCVSQTDPNCNKRVPQASFVVGYQGCVAKNLPCGNDCGLYFGGVCRCLKGSSDCICRGDWWLLNAHELISTSRVIPGIVELGPENVGWRLGQELLSGNNITLNGLVATRANGALAANSVHQRDQDQIHIHVCDANSSALTTYPSSKVRREDFPPSGAASRLPTAFGLRFPKGSVLCQAAANKNDDTIDVDHVANNYITRANKCDKAYYVGAGLTTDTNDYSWLSYER
ncbi:hypothetical protein PSPO01_16113 [Paraphaeosphaeria sporulosa]